jgi:hypothetical protein
VAWPIPLTRRNAALVVYFGGFIFDFAVSRRHHPSG